MYIAHKIKKENICEYLLYMWQVEDLIRAFQLNIETIDEQIVKSYPVTDIEKNVLYEWYDSLIEMMRLENVQQVGHLQINKNSLSEIEEFHGLLLKSGKEAAYNAKFYHILPYIAQLRQQQKNKILSDIEICFNFQYAIMLLRMKKTQIMAETLQAQTEISKFMILLNKYYQEFITGELTFDDEM